MSSVNLTIENYSEKAIAVFGDTKDFKDQLLNIGGTFNKMLKTPDSDERRPGWIFPTKAKDKVQQLINDLKSGNGKYSNTHNNSSFASQSEAVKQKLKGVSGEKIEVDPAFISGLLMRIEKLETEFAALKQFAFNSNKIDVVPTKKTTTKKSPAPSVKGDDEDVIFSGDEYEEDTEEKEEKKVVKPKSSGRLLSSKK